MSEPDAREALRQAHLNDARQTILGQPDMSPAARAKLDKLWADFDAAYPQPLDLSPKDPK